MIKKSLAIKYTLIIAGILLANIAIFHSQIARAYQRQAASDKDRMPDGGYLANKGFEGGSFNVAEDLDSDSTISGQIADG